MARQGYATKVPRTHCFCETFHANDTQKCRHINFKKLNSKPSPKTQGKEASDCLNCPKSPKYYSDKEHQFQATKLNQLKCIPCHASLSAAQEGWGTSQHDDMDHTWMGNSSPGKSKTIIKSWSRDASSDSLQKPMIKKHIFGVLNVRTCNQKPTISSIFSSRYTIDLVFVKRTMLIWALVFSTESINDYNTSSSLCMKFMKPSWWLLWWAHLGALAGSCR